jgi:hypothetical protein
MKNKRLTLWAHLVSAHATAITFDISLSELEGMHNQEHDGPGTIRNHDRGSREYSLQKLGAVLSEPDEEE